MRRFAACAWVLCLGLGGPALALTDEEVFRDFRFNLINPGARSLALGGSFISMADDATAAQANPAGLSYLLRPEYFVEYRRVDNGGRTSVRTDAIPGGGSTFVATGTGLDDFGSPSFLSLVYPVSPFTLGISRQEVLHNRNKTVNSFAVTLPGAPGAFLVEGSGSIDARVVNYNTSVGVRLGDRWAVGGSLAFSTLDVESAVSNVIVDTQGIVSGRQILEPTLDLRTTIDDTDRALGFNFGLTFRPVEILSIGAVWRREPKFKVAEVIDAAAPDTDGDGFADAGIDTLGKRAIFGCAASSPCVFANEFNLPDSFGVGVSLQPIANLTLTEDLERIEYGDQLDGYIAGVNILTSPDAAFTVDDVWEVRLGAEYVVRARVPLALRAGLYTEHDSTIRAVSTGSGSLATAAGFRGQDGQVHGTAGLGVVWGQSRFKADLAVDIAETANQYLISIIILGK